MFHWDVLFYAYVPPYLCGIGLVYVVSLGEVNGLTVKSASHEVDIQKNSDAAGSPDKKGVAPSGQSWKRKSSNSVPEVPDVAPRCERWRSNATWMSRTGRCLGLTVPCLFGVYWNRSVYSYLCILIGRVAS